MKWFFAINEGSPYFRQYGDMIRVAVLTAARHTHLEPHLLYDGEPCELTQWLEGRGVVIINRRWRLLGEFNRVARECGRTELMGYAGGIFLRMEVPRVCAERGWADEEVLYTDCDIMFMGDPQPLFPDLRGAFFGVGPESDPEDPAHMNSGVMLMRLPALAALDGSFEEFVRIAMADCARYTDQFAYDVYFRHGWRALPPELNWKPYWGENPAARIVHFHGPKPFIRAALEAGMAGTQTQRDMARGAYAHYSEVWESVLRTGGEISN